MATTATLNGGPTGGLHATPSLIHSDNPPPEEERVDSNSSFDSGHEDHHVLSGGVGHDPGQQTWTSSPCPGGGGQDDPSSYFQDTSLEARGNSKKRRKQSRPVRIPASELAEGDPLPRLPLHAPLNLSSRAETSCSSGDEGHQSRLKSSSTAGQPPNSSSENDKTELLAGQGTKDSPTDSSNNRLSGSPPLPPSFSPGLFPLSTSSPFSALFPGHLFSQHHPPSSSNPHQARTPTSSSSSVGSNSGGSQPGVISGSTLQNLPPHRIFNPEAYCDLCNKEFCNKYFLKTHKANKHGVYSELSPSLGQVMGPGMSASSPSATSFLTGTPMLSSAGLSVAAQQQPPPPPPPPLLSTTTLPQTQQHSQSSGTLTKGVIPSEIPFSLAFSMEKGAGNGNGSQQRESFCELCQKVFCNKYFLKRHKAKIHGIPIDGSSAGSGRSSSSSNPGKRFSNGDTSSKRSSSEGLSHTLREMGLESYGLELVTKHLADEGRGGDPLTSGGSRRDTEREEGEVGPYSVDDCPRDTKSPENVGESDEASSYKTSSLELKFPQLGALNSENTCQFCFREFPSRQLLYTHLVKKHRLLIPSSFPPFLLPFPSLFEEQAEAAGGSLDNNGNATGNDGDFECNMCNRTFQTVYLLRMHKSYFHPDSDDQSADPVTSKFITEAAASFIAATNTKATTAGTDEEGDNEQGYNSEHDSSGKGSPCGVDDTKPSRTMKNSLSTVEMEGRGEGTSDSDDLRRLQTMIMELNRVSSAAVAWSPPLDTGSLPQASLTTGSTFCQICSKEFYSTYFLQQHIQHYHTAPSSSSMNPCNNLSGASESQPSIRIKSESALASPSLTSSTLPPTVNPGESDSPHSIRIKSESQIQAELCSSKKGCGSTGDLSGAGISISQGTLKERLLHPDGYVPSPGSSNDMGSSTFLTPGPKGNIINNNNNTIPKTDSGNSAKRPSPSLSRSYCTICHKELCNKYFMRTHMLKMHGISIESSTGLGGVTCDICNKELCSKYFLKVHKQNTHGIVEEGPSPPNPSTPGPVVTSTSNNFPLLSSNSLGLNLSINSSSPLNISEVNGPLSLLDPSTSSPLLPKEPMDLQTRYFCHYSEVCPFCGRRFRSPKWLKSHLTSDHGEEGRERWKSIEKTLNLGRRQQKSSSGGKTNCPSGQIKGSSLSTSGGKSSNPLLNSSGLTREGNKCAFCNFSSGDMEVMKAHLIKEHGSQLTSRHDTGAAFPDAPPGSSMLLDPLSLLFQKMEGGSNKLYRCTYCPFTTSILVYLYAHERTHTGLGGSAVPTQLGGTGDGPTFQCPMCFHTFDQPEAFQQHLIGHQMSGVLAPFFTPTTSSNSGRLGFLTSPPGGSGEPSPDPRALLSLPFLNGNAGDNLYWALKSVPPNKMNGEGSTTSKSGLAGEETNPADLTTPNSKRRRAGDDEGCGGKRKRRDKISHFRCSHCQTKFKTREDCLSHIQLDHQHGRRGGGDETRPRSRHRKSFRCRKCKFATSTYQLLVVHCKLHHSVLRPIYSHMKGADEKVTTRSISTGTSELNLPEGRGVPQEGTEGEFVMQGFLLTSSEEESSNQSSGYFVPSVVYLPVREKVSQSIRVSFSLTPTS